MTPFPTYPYEQFNTFTYRDTWDTMILKKSTTRIVLHDYHYVYYDDFIAL